jgi:hypothetical protein
VVLGGLAATGGFGLGGAWLMSATGGYDRLVEDQTRPLADDPDSVGLVRYATLAASSHNAQAWQFRAGVNFIDVLPDLARRTPIVDPDDHHLYASIGCAAENLSIAAAARGRSGEILFQPGQERGHLRVALEPAPRAETPLFRAIPRRQCTRAVYDGAPVGTGVLAKLEAASRIGGVEPVFIMDAARREEILELLVAANSAQLGDPAFMRELKLWLRFNKRAAAHFRDGLFSALSGNPQLPSLIGLMLFDLLVSKESENSRLSAQVRSSSGLVAFIAPSDDRAGWAAAGRAYQRFALQATVDGLKHAFVNQVVEVPDARRELRSLLGLGERRPSLLVRFGFGPEMPRSLRRRARDVLVQC